ncbi:glycosyltransferase [Flavobacteriales bacterium]|nr:glycosyltransferase [Flavobacteriales bacterium]
MHSKPSDISISKGPDQKSPGPLDKFIKEPVTEYPNNVLNCNPLVSICVEAYQHEEYIEECLDSLLTQQTDFEFEILLGEDNSSDGTRNICIDYAQRYPNQIRLFLHSRENNLKVAGVASGRFNLLHNLHNARGKFVARCEGDDYWTDLTKLQKQVRVLERDDNIMLSTTNLKQLGVEGPLDYFDKTKYFPKTVSQLEDVALHKIRIFATCTFLMRKELVDELVNRASEFNEILTFDWVIVYLSALRGEIHFMDECTAVYRFHQTGIMRTTSHIPHLKNLLNLDRLLVRTLPTKFSSHKKSGLYWYYDQLSYAYMQDRQLVQALKSFCQGLFSNPIRPFKNYLEHLRNFGYFVKQNLQPNETK